MTARDELHRLIDILPDEEVAELLVDLRDAADAGGPPIEVEALASLDRGLADIAAGRVISLDEFERKNPL